MEEGRGDSRICMLYGLYVLFFACIVAGGIIICLYIFLDEVDTQPWYPIVGLTLVGIPWAFWILAYGYRCILFPFLGGSHGQQEQPSRKGSLNAASPATEVFVGSTTEQHVPESPPGEKHVEFAGVVTNGEQHSVEGRQDVHNYPWSSPSTATNEDSIYSRDSERPLNMPVSSR